MGRHQHKHVNHDTNQRMHLSMSLYNNNQTSFVHVNCTGWCYGGDFCTLHRLPTSKSASFFLFGFSSMQIVAELWL